MTAFRIGTPFARAEHHVFLALAALLVTSCIDVGHESEIGCKVDMTEPGCTNSGGSSAKGGGTARGGNAGTSTVKTGGSGNVAGSAGRSSTAGAAGTEEMAGSAGHVTSPSNGSGGSSEAAAGMSS